MDFYTVTDIAAALKRKEISSIEITQAFLKRIEHSSNELNSFITVTAEKALQQAKLADDLRAKGRAPSDLAGVPMAHKDNFCTQAVKTTAASKMLSNFIPPYNATVVNRLESAGLVMLGKTNMDEFAMGSSNETSFYGPVKNPWDTERVPGGSSGGSSAAVSGMLTPFATGSDTGGSIRQPASLCNLVGIKPTYGRVSRYGMVAFASSLDQAGPITHTVEDAAHIMNVIAGVDPLDSTSIDHPVPDYTKTLNNSLNGLTIGIPEEYFDSSLNSQVVRLMEDAIDVYKKLGARIRKINLKNTSQGIPLYYLIASAECASNLARYDGIHYGYRCNEPKDLQDLYVRSRSEGFGEEVKRRILIGTHILSSGAYNAYYTKAQTMRTLLMQEFYNVFQKVDLILGPTTPGPAFKLQEKTDDPLHMYLSDIYTVTINLAGLPAISLPAGFVDNLPVGMQLIGPAWSEARLLNAAHIYQKETHWQFCNPGGLKYV